MVNTRIRPSSSKILPKWLYPISACFLFVHCRMQYFILFFSFLPGIAYGRYGIINFYIWIYSYRYFKRLSKNQLRNGKKKSKKHNQKKSDTCNQDNCILVHLNLIENPVVHFFAAFSRSITQTSMYLRSQEVISHLRLVILQSLVWIYKPFMIRPINSYFFKILLAIL